VTTGWRSSMIILFSIVLALVGFMLWRRHAVSMWERTTKTSLTVTELETLENMGYDVKNFVQRV
jgi:hypothetical protein